MARQYRSLASGLFLCRGIPRGILRGMKGHKLADKWVVFEQGSGPNFDITDGQLLRSIQRKVPVEAGTRVRVSHYDDDRTWFEVLVVVSVSNYMAPARAVGMSLPAA